MSNTYLTPFIVILLWLYFYGIKYFIKLNCAIFLYIYTYMTDISSENYECYYCNFSCKKLSNWQEHLATKRHITCVELDVNISELSKLKNKCDTCGKQYKTKTGLLYHKNTCKSVEPVQQVVQPMLVAQQVTPADSLPSDKELVMMLLKDNIEFKKMFTEFVINNQATSINNSNNTTNSHNTNTFNNTNNFNLNFFLNEQCKDAININEFIDSINITFDDLENTAKYGYVDGVTQIIVSRLRELDTFKRPIHCSDVKRGTLYFKHDNKWEKDLEEKPIAKHVVRSVSAKNIGKIKDWIQAHPGCTKSDSMKNRLYHKIYDNAMSGDTKEEQNNNVDKVIRNLIREVAINKKITC